MAYKISEECVACGTCMGECPTGAIHAVNFPVLKPKAPAVEEKPAEEPVEETAEEEKTEEVKFAYDTKFNIIVSNVFNAKNEQDYKIFLESIGDSIVLVADDDLIKIHVHTY